jgi:hypothetical protein
MGKSVGKVRRNPAKPDANRSVGKKGEVNE